jgi:hypothetical protein
MQKTIALSTAEAEYYSASEIAVEIIYLRNLIRNMCLPQDDDTPVYEDNTACIDWGNHIIGGRERADINILISGRILRMKPFRAATCASSGVQQMNNWLTSLPRRYRFLSSNDA